jgi:selenocysteine lyase/cysteine desulfurase
VEENKKQTSVIPTVDEVWPALQIRVCTFDANFVSKSPHKWIIGPCCRTYFVETKIYKMAPQFMSLPQMKNLNKQRKKPNDTSIV